MSIIDITQNVAKIRTAVYGSEVREAIASVMEAVNSNAGEYADAASEDAEAAAQSASDALTTKTDMEAELANVESVVTDVKGLRDVMELESDVSYGVNRVNTAEIADNAYIDSNGNWSTQNDRIRTNYCYVGDLDSCMIYDNDQKLAAAYVLYGDDGTKLTTRLNWDRSAPIDITEATIGHHVRYIVVAASSNRKSGLMVVSGDTVPTGFVPYVAPSVQASSGVVDDFESRISHLEKSNGNILLGKKWAVCGDSFTAGAFTGSPVPYKITEGKYAGENAVYGYLIGNRNDMDIVMLAQPGQTMAYPADGLLENSFVNPTSQYAHYTQIPEDADYITLYYGINDNHHEHMEQYQEQQHITLGTINDTGISTFFGAYQTVLAWILQNRPNAHVGIIVTNGANTSYRDATIDIAQKWGIPYMDMNGNDITPVTIRSCNSSISSTVRNAKDAHFTVSESNSHPNVACHAYESTFIEAFLRTL